MSGLPWSGNAYGCTRLRSPQSLGSGAWQIESNEVGGGGGDPSLDGGETRVPTFQSTTCENQRTIDWMSLK